MAKLEFLWTITELNAQVALALSAGYEGAPNGRVRNLPDPRTIRYYTTLGLIDRPAAMRGRTALYGRRHLMQLVAIKRLQARGLSLAKVQQQLLGLSEGELSRLARLPHRLDAAAAPASLPPRSTHRAFWRQLPAPVAETRLPEAAAAGAEGAASQPDQALPIANIRLGDAALLVLAAARPVEENDLEAIRQAAAPLLKLLETRRLLRPRQERGDL